MPKKVFLLFHPKTCPNDEFFLNVCVIQIKHFLSLHDSNLSTFTWILLLNMKNWKMLNPLKFSKSALAGVAQWTECWPKKQIVTSSIPSQSTCLVCRLGPQWRGVPKRQLMFSPSFSLPSPLSKNKEIKSFLKSLANLIQIKRNFKVHQCWKSGSCAESLSRE